MTYRQKHRRAQGFTLTEVIIALFVFALLTLLFAGSFMLSAKATGINGQYAQALSLCQHKMDQLRAVGHGRLGFDELNDACIVDDEPSTLPYRFTVQDGVADLLGLRNAQGVVTNPPTTSISITNLGSDTRVKVVTVSILWKAAPNRTTNSSATVVGYIANTE